MRAVEEPRSTSWAAALAGLPLLLLLTPAASPAEEPRLRPSGRLTQHSAVWVTADERRIVFGSGTRAIVARVDEPPAFDFRIDLSEPALQGVFAGERLYLNLGASLDVLDLADLDRPAVPTDLQSFGRPLRIARMDEYLLVAEDGFGLRILQLPPPPGHDMPGHHRPLGVLPAVSELPLGERFVALASSVRTVHLLTADGRLLIVNARQPDKPRLERDLELTEPAHAVAANGPRVWLLGDTGLTILELSNAERPEAIGRIPAVTGEALELTGRTVHVAAGDSGLATFRDVQRGATTHFVTVSNTVFTPDSLDVDVGDTVQWDNIGGTHSVESCDGVSDPANCAGQVAVEGLFSSGAASSAAWTFSKVFNVVGSNRYFCVVHVGLGMVGVVTTSAPAPPGVPGDARPVRVDKLDPAGTELSVVFDTSTCLGNADHQIIFGFGSNLPGSLAGTYDLSGGECAIGATSPFTWSSVPDPAGDPGRLLWFLVLANDGAATEGSWGRNSAQERTGPGTNGSSGLCAITDKSLTNICGQ